MPNPDAAEADVVPKDPELPESIVRKMYIRKTDITEFGETPGVLDADVPCWASHFNPTLWRVEKGLKADSERPKRVDRDCRRQMIV